MSSSPTLEIRTLISADRRALSGVSAFERTEGSEDEAEGVMDCVMRCKKWHYCEEAWSLGLEGYVHGTISTTKDD
jgi:hypothetical protein